MTTFLSKINRFKLLFNYMPKGDSRSKNYLLITRLLAMGGLGLIFFSRKQAEPGKSIYGYIGLTMTFAILIVTILYYIKPGAFKNKSQNPDELS
jgi:hypothetical protein